MSRGVTSRGAEAGLQQSQPGLELRLRVVHGVTTAIGTGKAELLEHVGRDGSIAAAARRMGMSYRQAWLLVETMNKAFRSPLVVTTKGGAQGGSARLTAEGVAVLAAFRRMEAAARDAALVQMQVLEPLLVAEPAIEDAMSRATKGTT